MENNNGNTPSLFCNNVVVLRNGIVGVVGCFNNKPSWLIFKSYINPVSKYDNELKHKNSQYDVMQVYDGSSIENADDVFKGRFSTDGLELLWERKE